MVLGVHPSPNSITESHIDGEKRERCYGRVELLRILVDRVIPIIDGHEHPTTARTERGSCSEDTFDAKHGIEYKGGYSSIGLVVTGYIALMGFVRLSLPSPTFESHLYLTCGICSH